MKAKIVVETKTYEGLLALRRAVDRVNAAERLLGLPVTEYEIEVHSLLKGPCTVHYRGTGRGLQNALINIKMQFRTAVE